MKREILVATVVTGIPMGVALFYWRPSLIVNGYVFAIPLLMTPAGSGALNPSIVATAAVILLGLPGVLLRIDKIPKEVRSLSWPLAALGVLGILSTAANSVTAVGDISNAVLKYFGFAVVVLLIYVQTDSEERASQLLGALTAAAILVAVYSIFSYMTGRNYYPQYGYNRASGTFQDWNVLGGYMALLIFPTVLAALSLPKKFVRRLLVIGSALELVAMLLSLTLGAIYATLAAGAIGMLAFFRKRLSTVVLTVLLCSSLLLVVWHFVPAVGAKFSATSERVNGRVATYSVGFEVFRAHPWWGVGSETQVLQSAISTPSQTPVSQVPHNAFIAIGVEKGIFGVVLLLILVINSLRIFLHPARDYGPFRLQHYGLLLGVLAFLIQNISNLLILDLRLGIIWLAVLVLDIRLREFGRRAKGRIEGEMTAASSEFSLVGL
jgi:O-antigen ligase